MHILVINGSPKGHRSNTYQLTNAFLHGLQTNNNAEIKVFQTKSLDIKPCTGCFACWNKTPGKCCLQDDMTDVLESMLWADIVIWSFPLYYFSVPGPLKKLIDRQLPLALPFMTSDSESGGHPSRYDMSGKRHVVISTCGFFTSEGNYDGVNAMFDHMCGKGNYTPIYCGQGELFRVKELSQRTGEYLSFVRDAGREFLHGNISRETRENLAQLLFPRATFEAMADASWGVEKTGEQSDETLIFTRQMAALYNPKSWSGKDQVLEMYYTDADRRYQILLGKEGSKVLTEDSLTATTVIETPYTVWKAIASGEISGEQAMMEQKYRVKGNFDLMIYWDRYFGSEDAAPASKASHQKPTNMMLLLLPWMAFWITTSMMEAEHAARLSMIVSILLPIVFFKCHTIIFDNLSAIGVTLCSILLLTDVDLATVLPLSYLGFGIMWTVGGFLKIPLTAYYSQNDYGGEGMLQNPLFIRTNRILTLCWGILYLAMTVTTFILLRGGAGWIGTVNSVMPAVMGIFTLWFQKWYPAHYARGK